ncbi:MAG: hypothetical protein JWN38_281 [Candidatus Saccharibacteria bacterium]|nr:hypothetical protein [Candidatus Saccharibacteria bacterium]
MSGEGAVGAIVVFGGAFLLCEFLAEIAVAIFIGDAIFYLAIALLAILGAVTVLATISRAIAQDDRGWLFRVFAAPATASLLAWLTYPLDVKVLNGFVSLMNTLPGYNPDAGKSAITIGQFFGDALVIILCTLLALAIGLVVAAAVLAAPIGAVYFMAQEEIESHLLSFGCYLFTALYWQTAVMAVSRGQGHW